MKWAIFLFIFICIISSLFSSPVHSIGFSPSSVTSSNGFAMGKAFTNSESECHGILNNPVKLKEFGINSCKLAFGNMWQGWHAQNSKECRREGARSLLKVKVNCFEQ